MGKRDRQLVRWFRREGFVYPYRTVRALREADIKPQTAAALLSKETTDGRNVFGKDHGTGLPCRPPYSGHKVTRRRAKRLFRSPYSNGVGPCQLTDKEAWVEPAREAGGEWRPYINMLVGFSGFRKLFLDEDRSIWRAALRYNGSPEYANDFVARRLEYAEKLRAAGFRV